jgi:hypothetical protein
MAMALGLVELSSMAEGLSSAVRRWDLPM